MRSSDKRACPLPLRLLGVVLLLASPSLSNTAWAGESARCLNPLATPAKALHISGKVQGMAPPEEVRRQTRIAELRTGGVVSPDYVNLPRVLAVYVINGVAHSTIAAIVDGHIPQPGDIVELESRHPDPKSPCNFVPWTVVPKAPISAVPGTSI